MPSARNRLNTAADCVSKSGITFYIQIFDTVVVFYCISSSRFSQTTDMSARLIRLLILAPSYQSLNPLTPTVAIMGIKHPVPDRGLSRHLYFLHRGTLTLSSECQSAPMSKITNDGLTRSGTG